MVSICNPSPPFMGDGHTVCQRSSTGLGREEARVGRIGVAQAIEQLRRELGDAQDAGANQQLRFEIAEVEMELLVELREEGGPEAKVSFGVLSAGAGAKVGRAHTHRLKLKLNVRDEALGGRTAQVTQHQGRDWDE